MNTRGFCVFIHTLCQGAVPSLDDGDGKVIVFATEAEAQREIVDLAMIRLQQFLDGERDFEDAIAVEEFVVGVEVLPNGEIIDEDGLHFGQGWWGSQ